MTTKNTNYSSGLDKDLDLNGDLDKESIRRNNRDQAQHIFQFLFSSLTKLYTKQQQKYMKQFSKHVYRWARISSHHGQKYFDKTNDKKIQTLMNEFSEQFNKKYLPPIEHNGHFYEIYPSKELKDLVKKYQSKTHNKNSKKNNANTEVKKHKHQICMTSINDNKIMTSIHPTKPTKVLLLLDFDDTLIPSKMLKVKNYQITYNRTTYSERKEIDNYAKALNTFMDRMLPLLDYNKNGNIQILTNGSSNWVTEESMWNSGKLFSQKMIPFMKRMTKYKIDIISALDNWKLNCHKYDAGFDAVEPHKWKWICMKQLIRQCFGRKLKGKFNVKIISIGDSYFSEFLGAADAFKYYMKRQKLDILRQINFSLHRIKFMEDPTWIELKEELKWAADNLENIIDQTKSKDYWLEHILKASSPTPPSSTSSSSASSADNDTE